jgi:glycosyltransferase involved in cell wall biosynthesis
MKISYIIPVYNGSASIAKCLEHILYQKGDFEREIIVVNDGSTDGTFDVVQNYVYNAFNDDKNLLGKVFLHDRGHLGASATRNFGVSKATGDYLVMVDADTFLDITWTQQCLAEDSSSYDILTTNDLKTQEEDPAARQIMQKIQKNPYVSCDNLIGFISNGCFMPARMSPMIKYDEMYYVGGEDIDLLLTLIEKGV